MVESEVIEIITMIKMYYIKQFENKTEPELEMMKEFWLKALVDINADDCKNALMRHVMTCKWPPTVADLVGEVAEMKSNINTSAEAWEKCLKLAIKLPSYNQTAWNLEEHGLTDIELKALRAIGVTNIKMSEKIAVERSNFIKIYNELKEVADKESKLPDNLKSLKYKQELLLAEKKKQETKLLEDSEKNRLIQNALSKANDELDRYEVSSETKIKYLQGFKEKLKAGIK